MWSIFGVQVGSLGTMAHDDEEGTDEWGEEGEGQEEEGEHEEEDGTVITLRELLRTEQGEDPVDRHAYHISSAVDFCKGSSVHQIIKHLVLNLGLLYVGVQMRMAA